MTKRTGKSKRREFTRSEDEAIIAHSRGELSMLVLRRIVQSSVSTIQRRAHELGVPLDVRHSASDTKITTTWRERVRARIIEKSEGDHFVATVGENDPLLAALRKHHGDRVS